MYNKHNHNPCNSGLTELLPIFGSQTRQVSINGMRLVQQLQQVVHPPDGVTEQTLTLKKIFFNTLPSYQVFC